MQKIIIQEGSNVSCFRWTVFAENSESALNMVKCTTTGEYLNRVHDIQITVTKDNVKGVHKPFILKRTSSVLFGSVWSHTTYDK